MREDTLIKVRVVRKGDLDQMPSVAYWRQAGDRSLIWKDRSAGKERLLEILFWCQLDRQRWMVGRVQGLGWLVKVSAQAQHHMNLIKDWELPQAFVR